MSVKGMRTVSVGRIWGFRVDGSGAWVGIEVIMTKAWMSDGFFHCDVTDMVLGLRETR
jgi:hypothetical protein